ncbi:MutS protein-like protein 5 [Lasiodiplodia theobromae]|uniref:3-dehydrosphinganine reductase n=1 Tax=Lasiodiplodia theobromae TaxID=45133 RepID=A0A5N5DDV2_9PEZI|nr:MutS protein-like protein 5 [Lasiodiplodia theobromae]
MGLFSRKNHFQVDGRTVVITGGSQGMGRGLGKLLAQKGANVVIVARNAKKLEEALEYISAAKVKPSQRFHYISADVTKPEENDRLLAEVTAWNNGQPPDIVWANAGMSIPRLILDAPVEELRQQMDINYFATVYLAQSVLRAWTKRTAPAEASTKQAPLPRHFIMTSSSAAFVGVAGYGTYSPAKAALRNFADSLRQEVQLYNGGRFHSSGSPDPEIKVHCVCPGTITSPGHEFEQTVKHPVTMVLEEGDPAQTEDEVASAAVKELEKGYYLIATNYLAKVMRAGTLTGSPRNNWFVDTVLSWVTNLAWLFVQPDLENKVWKYEAQSALLDRLVDATDADIDALDEIIMAVDIRERKSVGCSYYVAREEKLYLMEDMKLGDVEVIDTLKLHIDPTVVLVATRADDSVLDKLDPERRSLSSTDDSHDQFALPYILEVRPTPEFNYDSGKSKLANLKIGTDGGPNVTFTIPGDVQTSGAYGDDEDTGRLEHLLRLHGWINLDSKISVGCAGAVLAYVHRRRSVSFLPGDRAAADLFRIATIEMFTLRSTMFVNMDTLLSLQILQSESHPHLHNQGPTKANSGSKEGLSVYGLFHYLAKTPQGRVLLRQYFLRPSLDLGVINKRLDAISIFLRPDNSAPVNQIVQSLKRIKNMRVAMVNLRKGVNAGPGKKQGITSGLWARTRLFAYHMLKIKDAFQEMNAVDHLHIRNFILETVEFRGLAQVGRKITDIIDFEQSEYQHRTVVHMGIDEELDNMKRTYDGIELVLSQVANHIAEKVPAVLGTSINVIFFPQIGFLITVPMDPDTGHGMYEGSQQDVWERMFTSEEHVYYKNDNMREMDDHFGDMHGLICDKEIEITHNLAQYVLEFEDVFIKASDICAELDALMALAQGARMHKLMKPKVVEDNVIQIKAGRHILQELTVPSFVANDTLIVGPSEPDLEVGHGSSGVPTSERSNAPTSSAAMDGPNMLILTGPNFSGKSIYMKQVAIIVYMAHVGSFVPAESARIGLTDKILTRIATRESVSRIQSAFMIDLQQVSLALNLATPRSLLVFDEFGKGTSANDGAGLVCGVFEYLLNLGNKCPKVLGATHFHEIFEEGYLINQPALQFGHMEVRVDQDRESIDEQITYLYNFRLGRSVSSFGSICAAMNGISKEVVARAEQLILMSVRGEDLVSACAVMPAHERAELEEAECIARAFLAADIGTDADGDPRKLLDEVLAATVSTTYDTTTADMDTMSTSETTS